MNNLDSILISFLSDNDRKELVDKITTQVIKEAQDTLAKLSKDKLIQAYAYIKQLSFIDDVNYTTVNTTPIVEDKNENNELKIYTQDNTHIDENSGIYTNNYSTENDKHDKHDENDVPGFNKDVRYAPFPGISTEQVLIRAPLPPPPITTIGTVYAGPPVLM